MKKFFLICLLPIIVGNLFLNNSQMIFSSENFDINVKTFQNWEFRDIESGDNFTILWATDENGKDHLYSWGNNDNGQLGDGTLSAKTEPEEIHYYNQNTVALDDDLTTLPEGWKIENLYAANENVIASAEDENGIDHVYVWGDNSKQQLDIDEDPIKTPKYYSTPLEITPNEITKDENYEVSNLAISKTDGFFSVEDISSSNNNSSIYHWGDNSLNQLGIKSTDTIKEPTKLDTTFHSDDDSYQVKGLQTNYASLATPNFTASSYIWLEDDGRDYLYGVGDNSNQGQLLGDKDASGKVVNNFTEVNYPDDMSDPNLSISQFYSSGANDSSINNRKNGIYSGYVLEDSFDNSQKLYTWGWNGNGNNLNGTTDTNWSKDGVISEALYFEDPNNIDQYLTSLPTGWRIESINSYYQNSLALITDDQGLQHMYYWGFDQNGISTNKYNNSTPESAYYYSIPTELSITTTPDIFVDNSIEKIELSSSFVSVLSENEDEVDEIYMWGNNANSFISPKLPEEIIYTPILIFDTAAAVSEEEWSLFFILIIIFTTLLLVMMIIILILILIKHKRLKKRNLRDEKLLTFSEGDQVTISEKDYLNSEMD